MNTLTAVLGVAIGLFVGAFNYWLLRADMPSRSGVPRSGAGPADPVGLGARRSNGRGLARRMLLRTLTNLGALFATFILLRDEWAILGTLFGLLVFPTVTVLQLYYEGRRSA